MKVRLRAQSKSDQTSFASWVRSRWFSFSHSMSSGTLIKVLTHLLIISSCCLIQSKDISSLDSKSDNKSAALLTEKSAQSCNNGLGRLVYEKISDHKLSAGPLYAGKQNTETISRTGHPIKVLEECVRRCQEDKMTSIDQCHSFDFAPGRRRSSKSLHSILPHSHALHAHALIYGSRSISQVLARGKSTNFSPFDSQVD